MATKKFKYPDLPTHSADVIVEQLPSSFKVDMLRHVHDHGPRVEWEDPKHTAWCRRLAGVRSGKICWKFSSTSKLEILIQDSIWITHLVTGPDDRYMLHHTDPALDTSVVLTSHEASLLKTSIFGFGGITGDRKRFVDACVNTTRTTAMDEAWLRAGASGARARIVDTILQRKLAELNTKVRRTEASVRRKKNLEEAKLDKMQSSALGFWSSRQRYDALTTKVNYGHLAQYLVANYPDVWPAMWVAAKVNSADTSRFGRFTCYSPHSFPLSYTPDGILSCDSTRSILESGTKWLHVWLDELTNEQANREFGDITVKTRGSPVVYDPPVATPAYSVRRDADGSLHLSSGVKIPFTEDQFKDWLEGSTLSTAYGSPQKIPVTRLNGSEVRAAYLIQLGCHEIDVVADLGGEYVELLKPDFEPRLVNAGTEAMVEEPGTVNEPMRRMLLEVLESNMAAARREHARLSQERREKLKGVLRDFKNLPQAIKVADVEIANNLKAEHECREELIQWNKCHGGTPFGYFANDMRDLFLALHVPVPSLVAAMLGADTASLTA